MQNNKRKAVGIMLLAVLCCIVMAVVEMVIEPSYAVKSVCKVVCFFCVPLVYLKLRGETVFSKNFVLDQKSIGKLLLLGAAIYAVVMAGYFVTGGAFDYAALVGSLSADQNVSASNFLPIALYISFGNSLLEEFMFRMVAYLKLSEYMSKTVVGIFSAVLFAVYHIGMIGSSFPLPLLLAALVGLAVGGWIFSFVDEKSRNIYPSWMIHMFADFALMTIWYLHIR